MKALVLGACGFAGKYMCAELEGNGYEVFKADISGGNGVIQTDITAFGSVLETVKTVMPGIIFNLAGYASVGASWNNPQKTMELNVIGTVNVLEAVRSVSDKIRVILIGSSDEYGAADEGDGPVSEARALNPASPYAVSKRCQEDIGLTYFRAYGLDICMTRSFNHIGAGQPAGFVVSDFARGITEVEKGRAEFLRVGNLSTSRCFTDVRDVVRAYRLIGEKGAAGRIYNVGSDKVYSIGEILSILTRLAKCSVPVKQDAEKMRRCDTSCFVCDSALLRNDTGWRAERCIEDTLAEILESFRNED